jgi:SAM-dependent MidA family methyltransferase
VTGGEHWIGLRRPSDLDPREPLPDGDPELMGRILAEIRADGPMTFARFMDLVLYDPAAGYYSGAADRPGRAGDFLTAPESHPIFGWAVARQVEDVWDRLGRPAGFTIREHGAGTGALAAGILDGLRRGGSSLAGQVRYQVDEVSTVRLDRIRERLATVDLAHVIEAADDRPIDGIVLANELLDALPVHRVIGGPGGELRELLVDVGADGALAELAAPPSTPALAARLAAEGIELRTGQRAEICLALDAWVAGAAAGLGRGLLLVIDYGYPAAELYDGARRPDGTLLAYVRHRVHTDPFARVGRQDLTAHVDLTALASAARAAGLEELGSTTQGEFLASLGAGELLLGVQSDPSTDMPAYLEARAAFVRMLDPGATGRFAVSFFGRALPDTPPLSGLSIHMPPRR